MPALLDLIANVMACDPSLLDEDSNFESIETWDSVSEVELVLALEHAYGVDIGEEEFDRVRSVRQVRHLLSRHGISSD